MATSYLQNPSQPYSSANPIQLGTKPPAQPSVTKPLTTPQIKVANNPTQAQKSIYRIGTGIYDASNNQRIPDVATLQKNYAGAKEVSAPKTPTATPGATSGITSPTPPKPMAPTQPFVNSNIIPAGYNANNTTTNPQSDWNNKLNALYEKLYGSMAPSAEETALTGKLTGLDQSYREGMQNTQDQVIPMEFITGQQQSIENRYQNQRATLADQLKAMQAQRNYNVQAAGTGLNVLSTAEEQQANAANFGNQLQQQGYTPYTGINTSNIQFKQGLLPAQQQSIVDMLKNKPQNQWNAQDIANWNYATGGQDVTGLLPKNLQTITNPYTGQVQQYNAPVANNLKEISAGASLYDPATGKIIGTAPSASENITPYQQEQLNIEYAKLNAEQGKAQNEIAVEKQKAKTQYSNVASQIQELVADPLLKNIVGTAKLNPLNYVPGSKEQYVMSKFDQLKNTLALNNRQLLKGSGAISDFEAKMLQKASTALNANLNYADTVKELQKIYNDVASLNSMIDTDTTYGGSSGNSDFKW